MKRCPYCAEIIKSKAIVCRFCDNELVDDIESVASERKKQHEQRDSSVDGASVTETSNVSTSQNKLHVWLKRLLVLVSIVTVFVFLVFLAKKNSASFAKREVVSIEISYTPTFESPTFTPTVTVTISPSPTIAPTLGAGSTIVSQIDGMKMSYVPAGEYVIGGSADKSLAECEIFRGGCKKNWFADMEPVHTVYLDAFWVDQTEVTNAMYTQCIADGACNLPRDNSSNTRESYYDNVEFENYPVVYVSWNDADSYCSWAGRRLLSESEWEKAARGGLEGKMYPWGDDAPVCDKNVKNGANSLTCNSADTEEVGVYMPNEYGIYDMASNVFEWTADWHSESYYANSPVENPQGPDSGENRVLRSASWSHTANFVQIAYRDWDEPNTVRNILGFRCAFSADE